MSIWITTLIWIGRSERKLEDYSPFIHTLLEFSLARDLVGFSNKKSPLWPVKQPMGATREVIRIYIKKRRYQYRGAKVMPELSMIKFRMIYDSCINMRGTKQVWMCKTLSYMGRKIHFVATLHHFGFFDQTPLGKALVFLVVSFQNGSDVAQITQGYGLSTLVSVVGKLWNCDCCHSFGCQIFARSPER